MTLIPAGVKSDVQANKLKSYFGVTITGIGFIALASRIVFRLTSSSLDPPIVFSPWGAGAGLTTRMDGMGLAYLFIPVLLLIASFWAQRVANHAVLLGLAGAAGVVFVAANGITFSYALLFFDALGAIYWLGNKKIGLALARLFLSIFTTTSLMLAGLATTIEAGGALLAFALWLRLIAFPFVEISGDRERGRQGEGETRRQGDKGTRGGGDKESKGQRTRDKEPALSLSKGQRTNADFMIWLALSTALGVYVAGRFLTTPVPALVQILTGFTILLAGWLAWIGESDEAGLPTKLLRMISTQPALALLISPLSARATITLGLGYTLALGALWLTPRVGRPNFSERHWLWIYAAPLLATLSLAGFPYSFGWAAHQEVFTRLVFSDQPVILSVLILSEGIAFSALYFYWKSLLTGKDSTDPALWTALILTIPFLLPGVAGITFSVITKLEFGQTGIESIGLAEASLLLVWLLALGFGYGKKRILSRLRLAPATVETALSLTWMWPYIRWGLRGLNTVILQSKAILEGGHYLGYAFLIALAGILVVILN